MKPPWPVTIASDVAKPEPGPLADLLGGEERVEDLVDDRLFEMPLPVSSTAMVTYGPLLASMFRAANASSMTMFSAVSVICPPSGIASRAFTHRFSST